MEHSDRKYENGPQKGTARVLRLKVVNLLYLIFFVLAFLYVPANFVDVFKSINISYEGSNDDYSDKECNNMYNYNRVIFEYLIAHNKDSAYYIDNLSKISRLATKLVDRIENHKDSLIALNSGYNEFGYLANGKLYNYTEQLFLKEGKADSIYALLKSYKALLRSVCNDGVYHKIDSLLNDDPELVTSGGQKVKWRKYYFSKMPVAGAIVVLSKFQNDVNGSENIVLESYIDEMMVGKDSVDIGLFTKILADSIIPELEKGNGIEIEEKEFYRTGELIDFAIKINKEDLGSIRAYVVKDQQKEPLVFDKEKNMLRAKFFPYEAGKYSFHFFIGDKEIVKEIKVRAVKPLISSLGINVFYAGIDNKVIIRHSNFRTDQLSLTASRGEVVKKDSVYILNFRSSGKVELKIYGESNGKLIPLNYETLPIIELPVSRPIIAGKYDGQISRSEFAGQDRLGLVNGFIGDKDVYSIKKFNLTRVREAETDDKMTMLENEGAGFSQACSKLIDDAQLGDIYIFDLIQLKDKHGRITDAPSIVVTINK